MPFQKILIANRGEIALRIARAAAELGIATVAVAPADDRGSAHAATAEEFYELPGQGAAAYLSIDAMLDVAERAGCDAVHPGYGFLSESATFARAAAAKGITFIGPAPEALDLFGDKAKARALARACGVPVPEGNDATATREQAATFLDQLGSGGAIMIKAVAGGGGRGMRIVRAPSELDSAWQRCQSEAKAAFGNDALYVERYLPSVRHIEVQVVGDGASVIHLGERECTIQRRHQKLIEIAPSPGLPTEMRKAICDAAIIMAAKVGYRSLGTFEFLVPTDGDGFVFIEANPRLQVEHTVTEEVFGVDLVKTQIRIASGATLASLGLDSTRIAPRGAAMQLRVNMETLSPDGSAKPSGGILRAFDPPSGPGVRVDTFGYAGYRTSPRYDSLLAKIIVSSPENFSDAFQRGRRALRDFRIDGVATNIPVLRAILDQPDFIADRISTNFIETHLDGILASATQFESSNDASGRPSERARASSDPLGVFDSAAAIALPDRNAPSSAASAPLPEGAILVAAPLQGTIVSCDVASGDAVRAGQQVLVIESMKMEHLVTAPVAGTIDGVMIAPGDTIFEGEPLLHITPSDDAGATETAETAIDLDHIRGDLAEALARRAALYDENRPDAVARRRKTNQRTARENIADLCDPDSFIEYGGLALASQRHRRSIDELRRMSPADGMVTGVGAVNGAQFDDEQARCAVMAYDYTVFAGTQGVTNHKKKDRLLTLADKWALPVVVFAEGGGGRPGDEWPTPAGLDTTTFHRFGDLNGKVPTIGVVSGRCFAGNAALLGCCDVVIATKNSSIGMGGPAMIEGGNLGVYSPEEVGPMSVQVPNGVVDIAVEDEAEAVAVAKKYLSYFQGALPDWRAADQRLLRRAIPENRLRVYDVREVIATLCDEGSVLELRRGFGPGMVTAFARIEGKPLGIVANNPVHLAGAIDSDGSDKAARFLQLCDAFDIPILFLCDTPGMMVGPEIEKTALVRHCSRLFVTGANLTVPFGTIILRKAYGLGAQAMAGGSFHAPAFAISWPTGEFGGMGLEGAVKLGYRKELEAISDPTERRALFDKMVAAAYARGKALSTATYFEVDEVIDPADSRRWITTGLLSAERPPATGHKKRPNIDTW